MNKKQKPNLSNNPIAKAVEPLRTQAVNYATTYAKETIKAVLEALSKAGWDAKEVAPYPGRNLSRSAHAQACDKYRLYRQVTSHDHEGTYQAAKTKGVVAHSMNSPEILKKDTSLEKNYIDLQVKMAVASYDAYVGKLVSKIGAVKSAELTGTMSSDLWVRSTLVVEKEDGSVERWTTQMIWNRSVYGRWFPQWPTRKAKQDNNNDYEDAMSKDEEE